MSFNKTVINFGPGPAKLPKEVLLEVQNELLDYDSTGIGVMELSHRSTTYAKINDDTIQMVKELLNVPDNYKILLMQGGGTALFAAVAANLISRTGIADYFITGSWSAYAAREAEKYGNVNAVFPRLGKGENVPDVSQWKYSKNASYVYYCANETVEGFEFPFIPETYGVPLVADMSSNILTKDINISKYGIIFAGAQKNIGAAGITVVIIREDLLGFAIPQCPSVLDFSCVAKMNSILNTPPTFVVYVLGKVLHWIKAHGGAKSMEQLSEKKSTLLYEMIDKSAGFYINEVHKSCRSRINVTFRIRGGSEVEEKFVKAAQEAGMIQLKGHRSWGGIRASLYNAITIQEVQTLISFMESFAIENTKSQ